ncbi:hypothetical protein VE01_06757 [Pseudogymnoascus verrucosus]|uniref:DUF7730 domain-containing protein n=1 Tax=Pseudogymnoascus verrucosus TaxID=342668 RepID=A0A1B8GJM7_9PEZI|nr:uncharacterized protein VE01_06757 [Pseudogymnoascus verrucosus]OBT96004.1 hypothetical protein VE01_06757 [Pseudogymnoascus verrucosus]
MEPNINPSPKLKLKPLIIATLLQARRLTRPRKPPITTPAPIDEPRHNPSPCILTTSLFLTLLPLEIRSRIYHFVFAGRELHLAVPWFSKDKPLMAKLRHNELDSEPGGGKWQARWRGSVARGYPECDQYLEFKQEPGVTGELLGLPLCCRQVYYESIRFLYASTGFTILHPPALTMFVDADRKGADFMRWVRVLRLEYEFSVPVRAGDFDVPGEMGGLRPGLDWDEVCRCLVLMTRLKVLHVTIYPVDALVKRHWAGDMVWEMLGGLGMARAEEFRVSVRKPFMKFRDVLGEVPFELCEVYEDY